jgi:hypothetical protein
MNPVLPAHGSTGCRRTAGGCAERDGAGAGCAEGWILGCAATTDRTGAGAVAAGGAVITGAAAGCRSASTAG